MWKATGWEEEMWKEERRGKINVDIKGEPKKSLECKRGAEENGKLLHR